MSLVTEQVNGFMANSSWIRKMFEAGIELKKKYGNDAVCDFSLGNPDLPPPAAVKQALFGIAEKADQPFSLGYMPNAGFADVREIVAKKITEEQKTPISGSHVIMSCGAAGGLNALFRAILTPGSEVICPSPYFVEYGFYAGNFGGKLVPVPSKDFTFELDVDALIAAVTPRTRAVILNSPHNPTGQIYSRRELDVFGARLAEAARKNNTEICLIADEPYRFLNFDNVEIPSLFSVYANSVVIGSYSKNLSLAGERIGYVAVNPAMPCAEELIRAVTLTTRILGYVNAPTVAQQILKSCIDSQVDLNIYRERRAAMAKVLDDAGIEYTMPRGAFYFFPRSPLADESKFIEKLVEERILAVPGRGFGCPGYIRLAFCVSKEIIERSAEGFKRAVRNCK